MRARALIVAAFAAACSSSDGAAQRVDIDTVPAARTALRAPALEGRLSAPEGFVVSYFAKLDGPRVMALGPDGAVYVSQPGAGRVMRLTDADGDGDADGQQVAVSGLDQPHGLAFHGGWLYVANTRGVVRVRLGAHGIAAGEPERLNHYDGGSGHSTRTIAFGPDSMMYVSIGSSCNLCEERAPERATVMQYDADGAHGRVYSSGLRNAVGVAVHPVTGEIWVSTHERDNIRPDHENLPPEEIDILKDGGDFGWPYCHSNRIPNPEYHDQARCDRTLPPALKLQAHSAPLGLAFLNGATMFPGEYRDDALLALHGSWNRSVPTGAKVVRIHVENGRPVSYEDFVSGWQEANGHRWGRPADVLVHRDGSVLISDDSGGAIFRVSRK